MYILLYFEITETVPTITMKGSIRQFLGAKNRLKFHHWDNAFFRLFNFSRHPGTFRAKLASRCIGVIYYRCIAIMYSYTHIVISSRKPNSKFSIPEHSQRGLTTHCLADCDKVNPRTWASCQDESHRVMVIKFYEFKAAPAVLPRDNDIKTLWISYVLLFHSRYSYVMMLK